MTLYALQYGHAEELLGGVLWGPTVSPRQTWNLVDTMLVWQDGQWLIVRCVNESTPAPVPQVVYDNGPGYYSRPATVVYQDAPVVTRRVTTTTYVDDGYSTTRYVRDDGY